MNKLFSQVFHKIKTQTASIKAQPQSKHSYTPKIQTIALQIHEKFGMGFSMRQLVRIPDNEIKTLLKIPCPVRQPNEQSIKPLKMLRKQYLISEKTVCQKCPYSRKCPLSNKEYMKNDSQEKVGLEHLLYFFYLLEQKKYENYSILRWAAAYRVASVLTLILEEPKTIKKQAMLYHSIQSTKKTLNMEKQQAKNNKSHKNFRNLSQIFRNRRFQLQEQQNNLENDSNEEKQPLEIHIKQKQ